MKYDDVALGVERALPRNIDMDCRPSRPSHAKQFMTWLLAAFKRQA